MESVILLTTLNFTKHLPLWTVDFYEFMRNLKDTQKHVNVARYLGNKTIVRVYSILFSLIIQSKSSISYVS